MESGAAEVLVLRFDWRSNAVLIVHNLGQAPREINFKLTSGDPPEQVLINLLSENHSRADEAGYHRILLEPYGYRWFRVGGLDYILRRSEI